MSIGQKAGWVVWRVSAWCILATGMSGAALGAAQDASPVGPERVREIAGWLPPAPLGAGLPVTNRAAWEQLRRQSQWRELIADAEKLARTPIPTLTDDLFLDFSRTGNRTRCQKVLSARDKRVSTFALAECLEDRGRFVEPLAESIAAIARERTWVMPAHDGKLRNFNGITVDMDLRATLVGWELATVDYLLRDKLPAATRELIRQEVRRRILHPFKAIVEGRQEGAFWLRATHNWNAVCLAGVTGAALALEEQPAERAWFVAAAEHYIRNFLNGFTPDGYCSEGVGYWNYGFGRFLMLSEMIRQATSGRLDLLADPAATAPALYAVRSEIINGLYPSIADCHPGSQPDAYLTRHIAERFGLTVPPRAQGAFPSPKGGIAPSLVFALPASAPPRISAVQAPKDTALRTWFGDGGVLICRPAGDGSNGFAAVLKGGHNAEHHNHNDVGSFSVVVGRSMVLCDPGAEVYTARTFSSRRYESKVLNSYGHSVPVLAGKLQQPGARARAEVLDKEFTEGRDRLVLDLRSAYALEGLKQLERTFVFQREGRPSLTVRDRVAFAQPETFETALLTWGKWQQISANELRITDAERAVVVRIEAGGREFKVRAETLDEDVSTPRQPVRLGIALDAPVDRAEITLDIRPE